MPSSPFRGCPDLAFGGCGSCPSGWCCQRFGPVAISREQVVAIASVIQSNWGGGGDDEDAPLPPGPTHGVERQLTAEEAIRQQWRQTTARWASEKNSNEGASLSLTPERPELPAAPAKALPSASPNELDHLTTNPINQRRSHDAK